MVDQPGAEEEIQPFADAEGWPDRLGGYSSTSLGVWACHRCGALVMRGRTGVHDRFHAATPPVR